MRTHRRTNQGFTFVELIVGVAVFTVIVVAVYNAYTSVFTIISASRAKIAAIDLVNEQLELIRNMPYSNIGVVSGIPSGTLLHSQTLTRDSIAFDVLTTVRNIDDPFDGTLGGSPNDTSPADSKLVEIEINCALCKKFTPIIVSSRVGPKNLETASTNGALFVRVFDASGNPVPDAAVHIENNSIIPRVSIDDTTNANGVLQIVDVPPSNTAYEITVTKSGYSTERTYASSVSNPNPSKLHATVLLQQVTQLSFVIDRTSTVAFHSIDSSCSAVSSFDFALAGQKLIGTSPNVLKYNQNKVTNASGDLTLNGVEWDTYTITPTDTAYDLAGISPLSPVSITPNSTQDVSLIVVPKSPHALLVTVRDAATGQPVSGAEVELTKSGYDETEITGRGFIGQTDWSGGSGQATSTDETMYLSSNGNIETNDPAGDIMLKKVFGDYVSPGVLTSSSFDTGLSANFQQLLWSPDDQPPSTGNPNVRLQIATNNDGAAWNFTGPDGTAGSYYTVASRDISANNNGHRYLRYKVFLDSATATTTPNLSDIGFTYTSSCTPPGQAFFSGLSGGSYSLTVRKTGYFDQTVPVNVSASWQSVDINFAAN